MPDENEIIEPNPDNPNPSTPVENAGPDVDAIKLQNIILAEENRRLKLASETRVATPVAPTPEPLKPGDTFNKPEEFLSRIQGMLDAQIKPLQESNRKFERQQEYGRLKQKLKQQNPTVVQAFGIIEPLVDEIMSDQEPTEANINIALERAIGIGVSRGLFQSSATTNPKSGNPNPADNKQPNTPTPTMTTPPHLRPSSSVLPTSNDDPSKIDMSQFDENEKRLMRENKMGAAEYLLLKTTPPDQLNSKAFQEKLKKVRAGGA
jgi:hypothetical protein